MRKRLNILLCGFLSLCILATAPAYGQIPTVDPFPQNHTENGSEDTPKGGAEISQTGPQGSANGSESAGPGASRQETSPSQTDKGTAAAGPQAGGQNIPSNVPQPQVQSEGAVLLDALSGNVLFSKNGEEKFYPASVTKLMTALLVAEKCNLRDTVTFSSTATTNLESGAVTIGLSEGDKLTVEQSLYALLLKSANEVANGLAEHVSGSVSSFADLMNARARELGCTGTNFANPNGLNNNSHYTTPYDMALISQAAFQNETVKKVASTLSYQLPATKKAEARTVTMGHKMLNPNDSRYYPGAVGGKTGYTSLAGNTLVTYAKRDGVVLVAVVMKSKSTHYADTKALLDYGFAVRASGETAQNSAFSGWRQENGAWYYIKQDGTKAGNEWQKIDNEYYWFDSDGSMATGWRGFTNGDWYYFRSSGAMAVSRWIQSDGKWFYVDVSGVMLKETTTPDGYFVDSDGAWVS